MKRAHHDRRKSHHLLMHLAASPINFLSSLDKNIKLSLETASILLAFCYLCKVFIAITQL
jgi:hypothetical protein